MRLAFNDMREENIGFVRFEEFLGHFLHAKNHGAAFQFLADFGAGLFVFLVRIDSFGGSLNYDESIGQCRSNPCYIVILTTHRSSV